MGEKGKMCLVRFLNSTVMVRVGGGWQRLDEFLETNDPCRGTRTPLAASTPTLLTPRPGGGCRLADVSRARCRKYKNLMHSAIVDNCDLVLIGIYK